MPLSTASDYIYQAFRKIGQLRPGYAAQSELMTDALNELYMMVDGWNATRTMAYSIPDYVYPVGTATSLNGIYGENVQYTIGPVFTFSGTTTITSTTVAATNTFGLIVGQYITGTGIPANTYITAISINTSITISAAATASGSVTITVTPSFTGPRPEAIIRMNLYMTSVSPSQPTRIPLRPVDAEQWANIAVIQLTPINVTTVFYYDPQFPQAVINVWPPLNGNSLEIFTWGFLTPPTSLSSVVTLPPGYQDAVVYQLAKRLYHMATRDILPHKIPWGVLAAQSLAAQQRIQAVNAPMPKMVSDFKGGRRSTGECNWMTLLVGEPY